MPPKSSAAPSNSAAAAQSYRMPPVEVGQTVLWRYGPAASEAPVPAVVLQVGSTTLTLALHVNGYKDHVFKTGVRYCGDPWLSQAPEHDQGVWAPTPRDQRIDALLASLGAQAED